VFPVKNHGLVARATVAAVLLYAELKYADNRPKFVPRELRGYD
jgi:hypothetical protein